MAKVGNLSETEKQRHINSSWSYKLTDYLSITEFFQVPDEVFEVDISIDEKIKHHSTRDAAGPEDYKFIFEKELKRTISSIPTTATRLKKMMVEFQNILDMQFPGIKKTQKDYTDPNDQISEFIKFMDSIPLESERDTNHNNQAAQGLIKNDVTYANTPIKLIHISEDGVSALQAWGYNYFIDENSKSLFINLINGMHQSAKARTRKPMAFITRAFALVRKRGHIDGHDDESLSDWIFNNFEFCDRNGNKKETKLSGIRICIARNAEIPTQHRQYYGPILGLTDKFRI